MTSPLIDENALLRRIEGIERQLRELGPSIAKSFGSTIADLQAVTAAIVTAQAVGASTDTFAIITSYEDRATANLTVPAGFTKCVIQATATIGAINSTASADLLYVNVMINGVPAVGSVNTTVEPGAKVSLDGVDTAVLTGLTDGQVIPIVTRTKSGLATFASTVSNRAQINAFAVFYN